VASSKRQTDSALPRERVAAAGPRRQPGLSPMGRWVEVLNAFLRRDEWGVRDLAAETGIPRSAVHRILMRCSGRTC